MNEPQLDFVIPTYRLRDVAETIEAYDENFWRNGHAPRIIIFDDSSQATQEKYFPCWRRLALTANCATSVPVKKSSSPAFLASV